MNYRIAICTLGLWSIASAAAAQSPGPGPGPGAVVTVLTVGGEITTCLEMANTDGNYEIKTRSVDERRERMRALGIRMYVIRGQSCRDIDTRPPVAACVANFTVQYTYRFEEDVADYRLECLRRGGEWHRGGRYYPTPEDPLAIE